MKFDSKNREHREAIKALAHLQFKDDFKRYFKYLQSELDILRKCNDTLTNDHLKWNQGKCQMLQEILNQPGIARKLIKNK